MLYYTWKNRKSKHNIYINWSCHIKMTKNNSNIYIKSFGFFGFINLLVGPVLIYISLVLISSVDIFVPVLKSCTKQKNLNLRALWILIYKSLSRLYGRVVGIWYKSWEVWTYYVLRKICQLSRESCECVDVMKCVERVDVLCNIEFIKTFFFFS